MGAYRSKAFDLPAVFAGLRPVGAAGSSSTVFDAGGGATDGQLGYRGRPGPDFPVVEKGREICSDGAGRHAIMGFNGLGNVLGNMGNGLF